MFITMCQLISSSYLKPTLKGPNPLEVKFPEGQYNMPVCLFFWSSAGLLNVFIFVLISSVGVHCRDAFIFPCLYVSLSDSPRRFLVIITTAC